MAMRDDDLTRQPAERMVDQTVPKPASFVIDSRGADPAAMARLERVLAGKVERRADA